MTMHQQQPFTDARAIDIADALGIDRTLVQFDLERCRMGRNVELEYGLRDPAINVTGDDPVLTGKIALAHLKELPDYLHTVDSDGSCDGTPGCHDGASHWTDA